MINDEQTQIEAQIESQIEILPEPTTEPDFEVFENFAEKNYRLWKTRGADVAFAIVEILRGNRRQEISMSDIATTQLYRRSSPAERYALAYVTSESADVPAAESDAEILRLRDQMLIDFADHKLLGHRDFQNHVLRIPARLAEKQQFDEQTFPFATKYESPKLFGWIFGDRAQ